MATQPVANDQPQIGRPPVYSRALSDELCERLALGRSLKSICTDDDMPHQATVFRWLAVDEDRFCERYARAREMQADAIFDEMLDISDNSSNDWMERNGEEDTGWQLNGDHVQRTRLRLDTRKWVAAKLAPKKYGDKIIHAGDEDAPLIPRTIDPRRLDPDQREMLKQLLLAASAPEVEGEFTEASED